MKTTILIFASLLLIASYGTMGFQAAFIPGWIGWVTCTAVAIVGFAVGQVLTEMMETLVEINVNVRKV